MWARSVCINESLEKGSVVPFLQYATENDFDVIIFNPNERLGTNSNTIYSDLKIDKFTSMEKHCKYIWNEIIEKYSISKEVYIIAHSMGGVCKSKILKDIIKNKSDSNFIKKIILTDSVNSDNLGFLVKNDLFSKTLTNVIFLYQTT
jgi:hypothetical protein